MGAVVLLAFAATFNPTEISGDNRDAAAAEARTADARLLAGRDAHRRRAGLVIVFALKDTGAEHTTRHTVSPIVELVVAALLVVAAVALAKGEGKRVRERYDRRHRRRKGRNPPKWQRMLRRGSPSYSLAVGILLSFPGVSYLAALDRLIHLHYSKFVTVVIVIGFCLMQNLFARDPDAWVQLWPRETPAAIDSAKVWARRHGREYGAWGLAILGVALAIIGVVGLLSR